MSPSETDAFLEWLRSSGGDYWSKVDCIECELGRPCLKSPPCANAEPADDSCADQPAASENVDGREATK